MRGEVLPKEVFEFVLEFSLFYVCDLAVHDDKAKVFVGLDDNEFFVVFQYFECVCLEFGYIRWGVASLEFSLLLIEFIFELLEAFFDTCICFLGFPFVVWDVESRDVVAFVGGCSKTCI